MADPISFTASVIAITTLTFHISELVRTTIHASEDIIALKDEVDDVRSLATLLESLAERPWPQDQQIYIGAAKRVLNNIVKTRIPKIQGYLNKLERCKIKAIQNMHYVALRKKINGERDGLRGAKEHLSDIVRVLNATTTRVLSLQTANISLSVGRVQSIQSQNHQDMVARLDQYFGPVQHFYVQDYRNILARFDVYFGPARSANFQTHREILTRFDQYLDRIQTIHVQDYQGVLSRYERYLGPIEKRQPQDHQDIVACFDLFLDRFRKRQMSLQQQSSYLTADLHTIQVAVSGMITKLILLLLRLFQPVLISLFEYADYYTTRTTPTPRMIWRTSTTFQTRASTGQCARTPWRTSNIF